MFEQELEVPNKTNDVMVVWVEPWAFEVEIPKGVVCKFKANSELEGVFEVVETEGAFELYGWCGSNISIFLNEKLHWDSAGARVPVVPEGTSVKDFVGTIFKGSSNGKEENGSE